MKFFIEYPFVLALIIPVIIALIILINRTFIKFNNEQEKREYNRAHKGKRIFITITRSLIALYLLIALSSPYTLKEDVVKGDYSLKILVDNSTSMSLFDNSVVNEVFNSVKEKIPVTKMPIASGTSSPIGNAIINNMHGDDNILLISDGQNNKGKELASVMFFANLLNTSISAVNVNPINDDYSVVIEGPSEAIMGTENEFYIRINKAGNPPAYDISAKVDERPVNLEKIENNLFKFSKQLSEGYHKITATIDTNDFFKENNVYYKTLHVLPKPNVLYVTEKDSKFLDMLKPVYTINKKTSLPNDLSEYASIIIDDIEASKLNSKTELLSDYVIEGGGLFVIGGENAFDKGDYSNSLFETILPVKVGEAGFGGELVTSIVIVLDISESTGQDFSRRNSESKVDVEKSLALEIIKGLSLYDKVGIVAFNHAAYQISPLGVLGEVETNITSKISKLHDSGGTYVFSGLKKAQYMLESSLGSKNIILISDGVDSIPSQSLALSKEFAEKNIKLYTVGVGEATNRAFLQTLAIETGAEYFEPTESQKLHIIFSKQQDLPPQKVKSLVLFNNNHFITKNLDIIAEVSGFNYVVKKSSSQMIVSMGDGKPIITVWRYGLGRVVALSTDDGEKWSSELLSKSNSKLLVRSLNWAIGDPQKNLPFYTRVKDTYLGDTSQIIVKSDKKPVSEKLKFEKTDENKYISHFTPSETGYEEFFNTIMAVNYPLEYKDIGFNKELRDLIEITGGKMFDSSDANEIVKFIKNTSLRKKSTPHYIRWPFIIVALSILILEIFIRKIIESRRRGK
ncbi:hypothetical protein CEE44_05050 [Candidatus Woesearchaeota archaeon B3_Woes]|nr:MAG: hypothetical protein CEE44_05050 [Candidatus Woesearchaeota archaeon B3_Woes]